MSWSRRRRTVGAVYDRAYSMEDGKCAVIDRAYNYGKTDHCRRTTRRFGRRDNAKFGIRRPARLSIAWPQRPDRTSIMRSTQPMRAFKKWAAIPPPQRADILYKAARLLKEREKELARLLTQEQGKPTARSHSGDSPLRAHARTLCRSGEEHPRRLCAGARRAAVRHDRQEADRRLRLDRAVEFPRVAAWQQDRSGAHYRKYRCREASRHDAADRYSSRGDPE